ncbi:MAG: hypothetical protein KGJ90_02010 [Patescibacteria group bacterium]|nr:hypothetical protein [Patescibacteria group bacterium]
MKQGSYSDNTVSSSSAFMFHLLDIAILGAFLIFIGAKPTPIQLILDVG